VYRHCTIICLSLSLFGENGDHWQGEEYHKSSSSQKDAASELMQYIEFKEGDSILDVGSGDGKITAEISKQVPQGQVTGLDKSPSMVEWAKAKYPNSLYPNLQFVLKDAEKLDFVDEFDVIFSFTALQWIDHRRFIKGAYQGLRRSGRLALTIPMELPYALDQALKKVCLRDPWPSYLRFFLTGFNFPEKESFGELLRENGFTERRLVVVQRDDIFPSREAITDFISQWFPYLRPIPKELRGEFMDQVMDCYCELEPPLLSGVPLGNVASTLQLDSRLW